MSYCQLNQVVTSIAVTVLDVVSLLEKISTFLCTWYVEIYLVNAFFLISVSENHQKQFCHLGHVIQQIQWCLKYQWQTGMLFETFGRPL